MIVIDTRAMQVMLMIAGHPSFVQAFHAWPASGFDSGEGAADPHLFLTGCDDGVIRKWSSPRPSLALHVFTVFLLFRSVSTRCVVSTINTGAPIKSVSVSPDAQLIACGHAQGHVTIWQASSMMPCSVEPMWLPCPPAYSSPPLASPPSKNSRSATPLTSSASPRASGGGGGGGGEMESACLPIHTSSWRKEVGPCRMLPLPTHRLQDIDDVKFSPDCCLLAAASHDNFIDIYEVRASVQGELGARRCGVVTRCVLGCAVAGRRRFCCFLAGATPRP